MPAHKYVSYVSGQDADESGNTVDTSSYVFDAECGQLVQTLTSFRFQKTKKAVLDVIIGEPKNTVGDNASATAARKAPRSAGSPSAVVAAKAPSAPAITMPEVRGVQTAQTPKPATAHTGPTVSDVFRAIATDASVKLQEMTDDSAFADLGIDSLMAISIIASLRNKIGVNLPPSFFMEHLSVGEARQALRMQLGEDEQQEDVVPVASDSSVSSTSGTTAPLTPKYDSDETKATDPTSDLDSGLVQAESPAEKSTAKKP